ncbi:MAG: hypothetical protein IBJ09_05255 [Bacteroidia bacterium]|nr:hypothetical protein [Bacteroidia bacterium]
MKRLFIFRQKPAIRVYYPVNLFQNYPAAIIPITFALSLESCVTAAGQKNCRVPGIAGY